MQYSWILLIGFKTAALPHTLFTDLTATLKHTWNNYQETYLSLILIKYLQTIQVFYTVQLTNIICIEIDQITVWLQ